MFPPALNSPADTALDGSDEQVISYLDKFESGSRLPKNVLDYINPYQFEPSNLPAGIWYIVNSTEKKENEFGFWRVKEATEIFTNSSISGRRTILAFELKSSHGLTDWVMQEYKITNRGQCGTNKAKEQRAICRVFLSSSNKEMHPKSKDTVVDGRNQAQTAPSVALTTDTISRKGSTSGSLMKNADGTTVLSEADKLLDPWIRDVPGLSHDFNGDYLELDDLADPLSHSSSSDNSSRSSMTFDEYFDPCALLQVLEDDNNQGQQVRDSSHRFSVAASTRPSEVVMQPPISGSLVCATGRRQPSGCKVASSIIETKFLDDGVANHTVKRLKAEHRDEGPSFSPSVVASSRTTTLNPDAKKKTAVGKKKRLKKFLCFMPF